MTNISVIIPTWNRAVIIKRAIDSALSQTIPPLEILICDDGSTDNTREIVTSYNNPKVKWIKGVHTGLPGVVRNRGIKASRGEWIAFLDSDDWWEKDKLEVQLHIASNLGVQAICSNAKITKSIRRANIKHYFAKKQLKNTFSLHDLLQTNYVICSSMLLKKQLVLDCGCFPEETVLQAAEDYALWLRIATKTSIVYVDQPLVNYFDDPASSIRKVWSSAKLQKFTVLYNFIKWYLL